MAFDAKDNFYKDVVLTPPSPSDTGLWIAPTIPPANWPPAPFNLVVFPAGEEPSWYNAEIIRVVDYDLPDKFLIEREQEGTLARYIQAGDIIMLAPTAKTFTDIEAEIGQSALMAQVFGR